MASKPILGEAAAVPSPSKPDVMAPSSAASSPASQLPKGFKVTGKYAEGAVSNDGYISGLSFSAS